MANATSGQGCPYAYIPLHVVRLSAIGFMRAGICRVLHLLHDESQDWVGPGSDGECMAACDSMPECVAGSNSNAEWCILAGQVSYMEAHLEHNAFIRVDASCGTANGRVSPPLLSLFVNTILWPITADCAYSDAVFDRSYTGTVVGTPYVWGVDCYSSCQSNSACLAFAYHGSRNCTLFGSPITYVTGPPTLIRYKPATLNNTCPVNPFGWADRLFCKAP